MSRDGYDPPRLAERLLKAFVPSGVIGASMVGDAREEFAARKAASGVVASGLWYWGHVGSIAFHFSNSPVRGVRRTARSLLRHKGLSATCVLTLAVGLGMNLAVFSVVQTVLLDPIGFEQQDRLVVVWEEDVTRDPHPHEISFPNFLDWREQSSTLSDMAAMGSTFWGELRFLGTSQPFTGLQRAVSYSFFDTLGIEAYRGRTFLPEDDGPGAPPVIVVSHRFWQSKLGEDPDAVGRRLLVQDSEPMTVVGILPPRFEYPMGTEVWSTLGPSLAGVAERLQFTPAQERGLDVLFVVARLAPGASLSEADSEMTGIVRALHAEYRPEAAASRTIRTEPLVDHFIGSARPALLALWGAVALVLLLACSNVAVLLLVRESARAREHATQLALGAGRMRLLRQLAVETAAIVLTGTVLGWFLAAAGVRLFVGLTPVAIPRLADVTLSTDVLLLALGLFVLTTALVAAVPALQLSSKQMFALMGDAGRGSSARRGPGTRTWLVGAQIAMAFVLLVGAGVMTRSFLNLVRAELGFDPGGLLTFSVPLSNGSFPTPESKQRMNLELLSEIETLPGVVAAAGVLPRPFRGDAVGNDWGFHIEGQSPEDQAQNPRASQRAVTENYFRTMRTRLLEGRTFTAEDDERAAPVIVVSENFALQIWPGESALGKKICCRRQQWLTVVGIVENTRSRDMFAPRLDLYTHYMQGFENLSAFFVRTESDPLELAGALRARVQSLGTDLFVEDVTTMDAVLASVYAPWRFNFVGFGAFAAVALTMAAVGLFGLLAFNVRERSRELGIRMALGATRRRIAEMVLRESTAVVSRGAAVGVVGGLVLTRLVRSLLFGASTTDALTFVAVTAVLFGAAMLATYLPAREAAGIDPAVSLRHE